MDEKLKDLCEPVVRFLKQNYNPYTTIEISELRIRVSEDVLSIPNEQRM